MKRNEREVSCEECMMRPDVDERCRVMIYTLLESQADHNRAGHSEQRHAGLQEWCVPGDPKDREPRQWQGVTSWTPGGDVDFSQVMPLASGSRTKKMPLGDSVMVVIMSSLENAGRHLMHTCVILRPARWQETGDTQDAMWSCSQSLGLISRMAQVFDRKWHTHILIF